MINKNKIVNDLINLGIKKGDLLNVKVSLKSIGNVEGGAKTVIEALLEVVGENGGIISDSFIKAFPISKLKNKENPDYISRPNSSSYAGAIANAMVNHPKSFRSPHPIQKFVGIGVKTKEIVLKHDINSFPYGVLLDMTKLNGKNLRIGDESKVVGVGTTHVAICLLGYKQNRRKLGVNYIDKINNNVKNFIISWAGGCDEGFNNLLSFYRNNNAFISEGTVGKSQAILSDMKKTLDLELELARSNPHFFMCDNPSCYKCRLTWEHSDNNLIKTIWYNVKHFNKKNLMAIGYFMLHKNYLPK